MYKDVITDNLDRFLATADKNCLDPTQNQPYYHTTYTDHLGTEGFYGYVRTYDAYYGGRTDMDECDDRRLDEVREHALNLLELAKVFRPTKILAALQARVQAAAKRKAEVKKKKTAY